MKGVGCRVYPARDARRVLVRVENDIVQIVWGLVSRVWEVLVCSV